MREADWKRCIAAGASYGGLAPVCNTNDGVVARNMDIAIVQQEGVCDTAHTVKCIFIFPEDGLVAEVSRGHDERRAVLHEKRMQSGVWKHHTDRICSGCNLRTESK